MSEKREARKDKGAAPSPGPGPLLRQTRSDIGISVDEVAEALRLSPKVILAIEEERYEEMPEQAYARGHVRSYAKLMEIDADQCVAAFNEASKHHYRNVPEVASRPLLLDSPKVSVAEFPLHYAGWILGSIVVILVLVAGIVLWYLWQESNDVALLTESDAMPSFSKVSPETPAEQFPVDIDRDAAGDERSDGLAPESLLKEGLINESLLKEGLINESLLKEGLVNESLVNEVHEVDESNEPMAAHQVGAMPPTRDAHRMPGPGAPIPSTVQVPIDTARANASPISTTVGDNPAGADATASVGILQFTFVQDCWVEVYDRRGATIHFGLERAPGQLNLSGAAPFTIRLGNGPGVRLMYNGTFVALDPNARTNVAELTLGE